MSEHVSLTGVSKEETPRVIVERQGLRLVHTIREQDRWPGVSNLVLERLHKDAMNNPVWLTVDTWCLSPRNINAILDGRKADSVYAAFNLMLTSFDVLEKE